MSSCKACLHYEVCKEVVEMHQGREEDLEVDGVEKHCEFFKPQSRFVEVRHGEWVYKEIFGIEFPECSACGTQFEDANSGDYPYCPNCGAKMDGKALKERDSK